MARVSYCAGETLGCTYDRILGERLAREERLHDRELAGEPSLTCGEIPLGNNVVELLFAKPVQWLFGDPIVVILAKGKYCCKTAYIVRLGVLLPFVAVLTWTAWRTYNTNREYRESIGVSVDDVQAESAFFVNFAIGMLVLDFLFDFFWGLFFKDEDADFEEDSGLPKIDYHEENSPRVSAA